MATSVWWDQRSSPEVVIQANPKPGQRTWMDIGTGEGARYVRDTDMLYKLLIRRGWRPKGDLMYVKSQGGVHDEDAWAERLGGVLRFLFPAGTTGQAAAAAHGRTRPRPPRLLRLPVSAVPAPLSLEI